MTRTQKEKMLAGEMYNAADPEIQADLLAAGAWLKRYNSTLGDSARCNSQHRATPYQLSKTF